MFAWLLFVALQVSGHGSGSGRTESYATELAKYQATSDADITCHEKGGNELSVVSFTMPECMTTGRDSYRCDLFASAWCSRSNP